VKENFNSSKCCANDIAILARKRVRKRDDLMTEKFQTKSYRSRRHYGRSLDLKIAAAGNVARARQRNDI
jgi:hypothetical protein